MSVDITIKGQPPGEGWPQYGTPVPTDYGHAVEVFMSSVAFEAHCWLRIYDPGNHAMQVKSGQGCDVMAHLTLGQAVAIRDRLTAFIEHREARISKGWSG